MNSLKTWVFGDTHGQHGTMIVPKDIDIIVFAGDGTNYRDLLNNQPEFESFIYWFSALPSKYKVLIAGNHDAWATKKYNVDKVKELGIIYLEHEYVEIEGKLIFGSPYTPNFGNWYFMKDRSKLSRYWEALKPNIDILITHGPPRGILDLAYNRNYELEFCGDLALLKAVFKHKPKYHFFGHIHNNDDCFNQGIRIIEDITFANVSCVKDRYIEQGCSSHGIIFNM